MASQKGLARLRNFSGAVFDWLGGEYRVNGLRFGVPGALTNRHFRGRFLLGLYELPERLLLARYLRRGATVLELGGCLGVVSCLVNRRLRDPSRHVVVEAHPQLVRWLRANRDRNGAGFAVEPGMVAREAGARDFWTAEAIVSGSTSVAHRGSDALRIPAQPVEEIEARHGLKFDALIIDIEGGEIEFLRDHPSLLARSRLVVVEFHPMFVGEAACEQGRRALEQAGLVRRARVGLTEAWTRPAKSSSASQWVVPALAQFLGLRRFRRG
ncbi:FkbM family methyltransferase [Roseococcus sp. YIM B11640]|uniref:FkbM family methyltransferase n=1 Tax=Roseococcus sp. YIM B11640 TaxID=3133973 RepID=UPI003C7C850D